MAYPIWPDPFEEPGVEPVENLGCVDADCGEPPVPRCPISLCVKHLAEVYQFIRYDAVDFEGLPERPERPDPSVVYFIRIGDLVKIGKTVNLKQRLSQYSYPELELLATVPGYTELEKAMHAKFAACRHHGEWFLATPALLAYIASLTVAVE